MPDPTVEELVEELWDVFGKNYFRLGDPMLFQCLDYVRDRILASKEVRNRYADPQSFLAFLTYYEPIRGVVVNFDDQLLDYMYFENLLKHYYITIKSYYEVNFKQKVSTS